MMGMMGGGGGAARAFHVWVSGEKEKNNKKYSRCCTRTGNTETMVAHHCIHGPIYNTYWSEKSKCSKISEQFSAHWKAGGGGGGGDKEERQTPSTG